MWVSYKKTFQNFGCRDSSGAEPQLWDSQLLCQCREGAKPRAQSFPIPVAIVTLTSPRAFLLMFFVCLVVSPQLSTAQTVLPHEQVENCTQASSAAPMWAIATHSCACQTETTHPREQRAQRRGRNNKIIWRRLNCLHLPLEKSSHQFQGWDVSPDKPWEAGTRHFQNTGFAFCIFKPVVLSSITGQEINHSSISNAVCREIAHVERWRVSLPICYYFLTDVLTLLKKCRCQ